MHRITLKILSTFVLFFSITACGFKTSDKINAPEVNKQIKERKIKRFKENEIADQAFRIGSQLSDSIFSINCGTLPVELLKIDQKEFINKVWVDCSTPKEDIPKQVWEAYAYSKNQKLELKDNIQRIKDDNERVTAYLFSSPKIVNDSLKVLQIELNHKALVLSLY
ncbi:hypothetical protein KMW28_17790 [Flammeovirga yaeyamensis]|uniref:Lipoprotein n=1 Tax=Flammeovirga yaeyamensis TaxID=367791 RepID=A0AAX1N1W2_9BACT|nr:MULTISPECIES: hypothetical protein [Flammeovirga]ANQ51097.1 hypothetical protein MY04_3753 [Flammeovirga sp. MY04]MBB3698124.1 hypothetical protein [Flammeovirga yaeyamensis]NMF34517.1 hypothetical protein [Flammeovirga yaeyamensis]QWG01494.1 hypothetical protein KMW28_17790 [Flammeovirga yaeyamensis]